MSGSRWCWVVLGLALAVFCFDFSDSPRADEPGAPKWKLTWSDEFDGKELDRTKWDFDLGNGFYTSDKTFISGWGNNELEYYTDDSKNVFLKDGMLHIQAVKEKYKGCGYTSARLKTRKADGSSLFSQKYGKFEFRAKMPTGKGVWPAIWMLPQKEKYGGWAASGEIDILEAKGHEPNKVLGTLHFGSRWPANTHISKDYVLPDKGDYRGLPRLQVGVGAWRDPLVRGRSPLFDPVVLVEQRQDGWQQGREADKRGGPQSLAGPVRSAVLPGHECGRGG